MLLHGILQCRPLLHQGILLWHNVGAIAYFCTLQFRALLQSRAYCCGILLYFCRLHYCIRAYYCIRTYYCGILAEPVQAGRCRTARAEATQPPLPSSHLFPLFPRTFFTASISIFERTVWECRNAKKNRKTYMTHILGRGNLFLPLPLFRQFGGWIQICNLGTNGQTNLPTGAGAGDAFEAINAIADGFKVSPVVTHAIILSLFTEHSS